jgi:hypothetical protein
LVFRAGVASVRLSRNGLILLIGVGVLVLYILGIFVRGEYGIAILVCNATKEPLRHVLVKVESRGEHHDLGDLGAEKHTRVFVRPATESHITLEYVDSTGRPRSETVVGYVEAGYCGKAEVTVFPDRIISNEKIDLIMCWRSWLDFL